jgi:hypothetical protein
MAKIDHCIDFQEKRQFFSPKIAEMGESSDHNIVFKKFAEKVRRKSPKRVNM